MTGRDLHFGAAARFDDLAGWRTFDAKLAPELRRLAARQRLQTDIVVHPTSTAWALLKAGEHKAPGAL